jgi:D-glycero-D-manno-heptose 1,7-bisphosphate phosphatase
MTSPAKVRALFLDRDGVVNEDTNFLYRREDVRWVEGIVPLCLAAQSLGFKIIVVTNQSGIGRGLYTMAQFDELTTWMLAELALEGVTLDGVYCCPYHPVHGIGEYKREHEDRKPSPGMLRRAAIDHWIELSQSIMVGDRCSDVGAANAAGLRQAFLIRGTEVEPCPGSAITIDSLAEVTEWLRVKATPLL